MKSKYKNLTKDFEGLRLKPYRCSAGKLTIGYGRNIEDIGISKEEAYMMFESDFNRAMEEAKKLCEAFNINYRHLSESRFYVLTDMMFNLGYDRLSKFKKMLTALSKGDYEASAKEMLDSKWAKQVGKRATFLESLMRHENVV